MSAFAIGVFSLIGIPPLAGFLSKWMIIQGAAQAGNTMALVVLGLSTMLNAAYFLPIVYAAFWRAPPAGAAHGEAPWPMVVALLATAAATIALPFAVAVPLGLAR